MFDIFIEVRRFVQKNLNVDDILVQSDLFIMRSIRKFKKIRKFSLRRKSSKFFSYREFWRSEKLKREKLSGLLFYVDDEGSGLDDDFLSMLSQKSIEVRISSVQFQYESDYIVNESDNSKEEK